MTPESIKKSAYFMLKLARCYIALFCNIEKTAAAYGTIYFGRQIYFTFYQKTERKIIVHNLFTITEKPAISKA